MLSEFCLINSRGLRDLGDEALISPGRPRIMPASYYRAASLDERVAFCVRNGLYCLPTAELVDWLRNKIAGRTAVEIGAGNGVLADALGIPATDSRLQEDSKIAAVYAAAKQPLVVYGEKVERLNAAEAVERYRPRVVIASWVTHRYRADRPEAGGSMFGVDEEDIIASCEEYIFIGNSRVHAGKSVWALSHERLEYDWLFSRAFNGSPDFIATWSR